MPRKDSLFITLDKLPVENGRAIGRIGRSVLRKRIQATRKIQKANRIADTVIHARVSDFTRVIQRVDSSWLDEVGGMAQGAGVKPEEILMLNCLPGDFYTAGHACTTFVSVGPDENMLLKIRDERNWTQAFFIQRNKGRNRFQGGRDIGNIGAAHFFNEYSLGGASNTGSATARMAEDARLSDWHVLRYVAENVSRVADIPKVFDYLLDIKAMGGCGGTRGMIDSFVDAERGLILEAVGNGYAATRVTKGLHVISNHFVSAKAKRWITVPPNKNTLLRRARMRELLARCGNRPTPQEVFAICRDRKNSPHSLCNHDLKHFWMTISAQLQVVNRKIPAQSVNYACCGNTRHSFFLPVPVSAKETYLPMLSGEYYRTADALYRKHMCSSHLQKAQRQIENVESARMDYAGLCATAFAELKKALRG